MNTNQIIKISLLAIGVAILIKLGSLAWLFTAGMRAPVKVPEPDYWPTTKWQSTSPEAQGFESVKLAEGLRDLQEKKVDIDSLLIIRNGYVVLDAHFAPYDGSFPHDLASVTKSVMTTLIAIAVEQGKIDLDQMVISFFPERSIANLDERKGRLTVRHLVGMVNGMESRCMDDDEATLDVMRTKTDWVQAALDRPMVAEPGDEFCYDSPGMHLLSAVLQEATGMTAFDFAKKYLFEPLGIQDAYWDVDPQGYTRGWGDLHLLPEDAAKIGYLWLHRGKWNGQQIVPEAWVLDSVRAHSKFVRDDFGYGYGWWVAVADYHASGRGGQKIRVIASKNTIVVTTGANYDYGEVEAWLIPALLQLKDSRPENPEGQATLNAALAAVQDDGSNAANVSSPEIAAMVSGKTYLCQDNPADVRMFRMEFNDPDETRLKARIGESEIDWVISLDGTYHMAADGSGFRGNWVDEKSFQYTIFDIGVTKREFRFEGDDVQIDLPELEMVVDCTIKTP